MSARISVKGFVAAATLAAAALAVVLPVNVYGDPPPWAPAHGWRKKNDPYYTGYSGRRWDKDYGIVQGQCNREAVGAAVGGVVAGAVVDVVVAGPGLAFVL